jgi:hypothetical protein
LLEDSELTKIKGDFSLTPRCMPFEYEGKKILIGKAY